jgi:hypothetical protein
VPGALAPVVRQPGEEVERCAHEESRFRHGEVYGAVSVLHAVIETLRGAGVDDPEILATVRAYLEWPRRAQLDQLMAGWCDYGFGRDTRYERLDRGAEAAA